MKDQILIRKQLDKLRSLMVETKERKANDFYNNLYENLNTNTPSPKPNTSQNAPEFSEEKEKLVQAIETAVKFGEDDYEKNALIKSNGNVIFKGIIQTEQPIGWEFRIDSPNAIFISAAGVQLDDKVLTILNKLKGYYDIWYNEWLNKNNTQGQ